MKKDLTTKVSIIKDNQVSSTQKELVKLQDNKELVQH